MGELLCDVSKIYKYNIGNYGDPRTPYEVTRLFSIAHDSLNKVRRDVKPLPFFRFYSFELKISFNVFCVLLRKIRFKSLISNYIIKGKNKFFV